MLESIEIKYKKENIKNICIIVAMCFLCFILFIISLSLGSAKISFLDTIRALFNKGNEINKTIILKIRLPKAIAALVAGAGLSLAGCIMQSVLKNDMASASTLGVSNASVFGANFAIIVLNVGSISATQGFNINISNPYVVSIFAFIFAFLDVFLILLLSARRKFSPSVVVLCGVVMGLFFTALTTLVQYFAKDNQLSAAIYWSFGNLSRVTNRENIIMAVVIISSFIFFILNSWNYNALASGSDVAKTLGVRVDNLRFISLALSSLISAVCVSFMGIIGFVGLIAPHIMKKIIGNNYRFLIPASFVGGSVVLLFANVIVSAISPSESLPIGAITSIIGAPLFLVLLLSKKRRAN